MLPAVFFGNLDAEEETTAGIRNFLLPTIHVARLLLICLAE
jgi:hypothetical protein